jgi:ATP diphosphatase
MKALLDIMSRLRDPEGGCPWDLEQDFSSISPHTIEEAYEVDEAIASGDLDSLRDELGDLLFQVVFQARIAEEMGAFDFEGVTEAIVSKLIRRHPHVFADAATPDSVSEQARNWESIKDAERKADELARDGPPDPFAGIPRNLPALARSAKLAGRLARLELKETEASSSSQSLSSDQILSHLTATLSSAQKALARKTDVPGIPPDALRLVGEGLRAWVGVARALDVDPEQALRSVDDETIASFRK